MKVIEISKFGEPEVLKMGERDLPEIEDTQVLVKVAAAGVNGPDMMQRKGLYPPPKGASDILGLEVAGVVVGKGGKVARWEVGDEICGLTNGGGYAEYVAIDADHCLPVPQNVSLRDAAGLPETYFTVWSNVFFRQDIPDGARMLVHGGAGGIGTTAIQLANARGIRIFTTCSTDEKKKFCEELGAVCAIQYEKEDFVAVVKEAGGADIIVDTIGGEYVGRNLKCAKMDARILQLAFNKGSKIEVDMMPMMLKRITMTGSTLRPRSAEFKAEIARDLEEKIWGEFGEGKIKPLTFQTFPLEQAQKAHEMMESKKHIGKIILTL